jgi:hypothetical protein
MFKPTVRPTEEELARQRHEVGNAFLIMSEQLAPLFDAADGMRKDLEGRGWSPTAAEQVVVTWLIKMLGAAMDGES